MEEVTFSMCLQGNILRVETKAGPISFNLYRMDLMDAKSALINKGKYCSFYFFKHFTIYS
jgi:hypothetical protein